MTPPHFVSSGRGGKSPSLMAGQVSAVDLAAVSVASSFWLPIILLVQGIIMALTPIVSQLNGARKQDEVRPAVHQGFWLALIVTPIAMVALYFSPLALQFMDVDPVMAAKTAGYLHAILWGLPAFVMFQVLRNFSEGLSHTMPTMVIGFVGLAVNIPANYIFIHGHFGMPKLGGVGCGVATAIVLWAMLLAMIVYVKCSAHFKRINLFAQLARPNGSRIWRLFRLGFPIAMAIFCEVTLFTVVALMLAPFGAETVASHQIALNFSSLVFMLPLSIGVGVTIRVGHNIGEGQPDQARVAARTGLMLGFCTGGGRGGPARLQGYPGHLLRHHRRLLGAGSAHRHDPGADRLGGTAHGPAGLLDRLHRRSHLRRPDAGRTAARHLRPLRQPRSLHRPLPGAIGRGQGHGEPHFWGGSPVKSTGCTRTGQTVSFVHVPC